MIKGMLNKIYTIYALIKMAIMFKRPGIDDFPLYGNKSPLCKKYCMNVRKKVGGEELTLCSGCFMGIWAKEGDRFGCARFGSVMEITHAYYMQPIPLSKIKPFLGEMSKLGKTFLKMIPPLLKVPARKFNPKTFSPEPFEKIWPVEDRWKI